MYLFFDINIFMLHLFRVLFVSIMDSLPVKDIFSESKEVLIIPFYFKVKVNRSPKNLNRLLEQQMMNVTF